MRFVDFIFVGVGAMFGANARYALVHYFTWRFGPSFPYGTLFINISGSFLLGFLMAFLSNRLPVDPGYRLLIGTGFLGAYTTFSAFSFETVVLAQRGELLAAMVNSVVSLVGCLLAAYAGIVIASLLG